ncbi:MAG: glycosyl transferase family 90 [Chthoniobacterales bacterium]
METDYEAGQSVLARFLSRWRRLPPRLEPNPLLATNFRRSLCEYFCAGNGAAISRAVTAHLPVGSRVIVSFEAGAVRHPMSCVWSLTKERGSHFTFSILQPGQLLEVVVERWLSLFELFLAAAEQGGDDRSTVINFNDLAAEPGLAFSGNAPEHILLPDFEFLRSHGYRDARLHFARNQPKWEERSPRVFWRGSSVGQKHHPILEMPRARLCLLGQRMGDEWGDIGLAEIFHVSEADAKELRRRELVKQKVKWRELNNYRFHIDIDGHASSYSGLFRKLLSGGLVLKVQSPEGCRQWYYDDLVPGVNFVPVRSDLSDLVETVSYYREHPRLAKKIAARGRELALSMDYEKEFAFALRAVTQAFSATSRR